MGVVGVFSHLHFSDVSKILSDDSVVCTNKSRHHDALYGFHASMNDPKWAEGVTELLGLLKPSDFSMKPLTFDLHVDNLHQR